MKTSVNLASRPFRNERLTTLLIVATAVALTALSVAHVVVARDLWPDRLNQLERQVASQEAEIAKLRAEASAFDTVQPPEATLKLWEDVRRLVERRRFSWTRLLARLEVLLPDGLRLVSIGSGVEDGRIELRLTGVARNVESGFAFAEALRGAPEFDEAYPLSLRETVQGVELDYVVRYSSVARPHTAAGGPSR